LHAEHLQGAVRGARLVSAVAASASRAADRIRCPIAHSVQELLDHPDVEAVVIASPSCLHWEHAALALAAGKGVFCEKPMADSVDGALAVVELVHEMGAPFQIAFQRRYDPGYARAKELILCGAIGKPEMFRAISCDHTPPPLAFAQTSGGLFWDLGVHDFDAARFLMGEEIVAVHAVGAVLVEPGLAALDDVDYGLVSLRFESGALGVVQNSRRAAWGYEIRAEVYGSTGKVVTELDERLPVRLYAADGIHSERYFQFIERFRDAYRLELQAFVDAVRAGVQPKPGPLDGLNALRVAEAATRSRHEGRWVTLEVS
jgi:myo-inositol 2-dehydrogenase / D-chiro-inositol 1-dehydrogenase